MTHAKRHGKKVSIASLTILASVSATTDAALGVEEETLNTSSEHEQQPASQTPASETVTAVATVATPNPSRLINRLCKHWGHKFAVQHDEQKGEIQLPTGNCRLQVVEGGLRVVVEAEEPQQLQKLQQVVAEHLERMATGETLSFTWQ